MKKFLVGLLAFICAIAIWWFPAGLILLIFKPITESLGAFIYAIFIFTVAYPLKYMTKSFYQYFLKKIDNIIEKSNNTKISENFTYENIDFSNSKNSNYKEQKLNSQNHIDNILQRQRDNKFQSDI